MSDQPPKRQICDIVYMTVEGECVNCGENLAVWVTSYAPNGTSHIEEWSRPPLRADGMSVLQHKDDEAVMIIFREADGRVGTVIWPVDPGRNHEQHWADINGRAKQILSGEVPRFESLIRFVATEEKST